MRKAIDFPQVTCAAVITAAAGTVSKASIVLGGVYNSPRVATEAQTSITGQAINATTAAAAGAAAVTAASALPWNKYKIQITKTYVKRALLATLTPATLPTPPTPPASTIPPIYTAPATTTTTPPTSTGTTTTAAGATITNAAGGGNFSPLTLPIVHGTAVTILNQDDADVVFASDYPTWPATNISVPSHGTASFTFTQTGTWHYWAVVQPNYKGTIIVS